MTNPKTIRTYSELIQYDNFADRLEYLRLWGTVGEDTFGFDRYLNQIFYTSPEWRKVRKYVITRDCGCDLGIKEFEIIGKILIHHMNPLTKEDIINKTDFLLNPEYLISTSSNTHQVIHYGRVEPLHDLQAKDKLIIRTKNDTCPWRH